MSAKKSIHKVLGTSFIPNSCNLCFRLTVFKSLFHNTLALMVETFTIVTGHGFTPDFIPYKALGIVTPQSYRFHDIALFRILLGGLIYKVLVSTCTCIFDVHLPNLLSS